MSSRPWLSLFLLCLTFAGCGGSPAPSSPSQASTSTSETSVPKSEETPDTKAASSTPEITPEMTPQQPQEDPTKKADEIFKDLVNAYREPDPTRWDERFTQLLELRGAVAPTLEKALTSGELIEREMASTIAAAVAHEATELESTLRSRLDDTSDFVKVNCAAALAVIQPEDESVRKVLISLLDNENESIVLTSISALGNCGPAAKDALPKLQTFSQTGSDAIKEASAIAIQQINEESPLIPPSN